MLSKDDLWEWFLRLSEIEQTAIARYLISGNPDLILAFASSSDVLMEFRHFINGNGIVEGVG